VIKMKAIDLLYRVRNTKKQAKKVKIQQCGKLVCDCRGCDKCDTG